MIIETGSAKEREDVLRQLRVVNRLRRDSHLLVCSEAPWIRVVKAKEQYL